MRPQPKCPECEKLASVSEESNKIGNFFDWMQSETAFRVCEYDETENYYFSSSHYDREQLLAKYFEIDLDKVEKERKALLEWVQEQYEENN